MRRCRRSGKKSFFVKHGDCIHAQQGGLKQTVQSEPHLGFRIYKEKNRVEVADAPKASLPLLYHAWKMPSTNLESPLSDEADSAFNSFNFWRETLPPVEEECSTTNYGDFSWWRVTPPDEIDLSVISDDSE